MEQTSTLSSGVEIGCVVHTKRRERTRGKQGRVLLLCGRLQGIAQKIICDVGIKSGGAGSEAEMLIGQRAPACSVIRKRKVRRVTRSAANLARQAGCMSRKIREHDGSHPLGHE